MSPALTDNEEQLVADLAVEFFERWRAGEQVSMRGYLELLPNDQTRRAFKRAANASCLFATTDKLCRRGFGIGTARSSAITPNRPTR